MAEKHDPADSAAIAQALRFAAADPVLEALSALVNRSPKSRIGITVTVGGIVLSGDLVSGEAYQQWLEESLSAATGHEFHGVFDSTMLTGSPAASPGFVHLRDARVVSAAGNAMEIPPGFIWRIRIQHVESFLLGRVE